MVVMVVAGGVGYSDYTTRDGRVDFSKRDDYLCWHR